MASINLVEYNLQEEFESIKLLTYENWKNEDETEIGFEYKGQWIINPFIEESGRFEFTDFDTMCKHYGTDNIASFISAILSKARKNNG